LLVCETAAARRQERSGRALWATTQRAEEIKEKEKEGGALETQALNIE